MISTIFLLLLVQVLYGAESSNPVFHHFCVGAINGTIVTDGPVLFAENPFLVPEATVKASYAAACRQINPIVLQQNVLIADVPKVGRVIIDPGSRSDGPSPISPDSGKLFDNMALAGISPESIDIVLLTHGHPDHISGIRLPKGGRAFPNAHVYISRTEHEFWSTMSSPLSTDTSEEALEFFSFRYLSAIESYQDRIHLVPDNGRPLRGVRFRFGPGHSPGHSAIVLGSQGQRIIAAGDTWVSRPDQLQHPEWKFLFETNHLDAYRSRLRLLRYAAIKRATVLAYHEEFPGLGHIRRKAVKPQSFDWGPLHGSASTC